MDLSILTQVRQQPNPNPSSIPFF